MQMKRLYSVKCAKTRKITLFCTCSLIRHKLCPECNASFGASNRCADNLPAVHGGGSYVVCYCYALRSCAALPEQASAL